MSNLGNRNYKKAQDLVYEELGSKYANKRIPGTPYTIADTMCIMLSNDAYGEELAKARQALRSALNEAEISTEYSGTIQFHRN